MKEVQVTVINETGLHARPASILTKTATEFESDIRILKSETKADAKSIINVLSLGLKKDDVIVLQANGVDEEDALVKITSLFESGFGDIHG